MDTVINPGFEGERMEEINRNMIEKTKSNMEIIKKLNNRDDKYSQRTHQKKYSVENYEQKMRYEQVKKHIKDNAYKQ